MRNNIKKSEGYFGREASLKFKDAMLKEVRSQAPSHNPIFVMIPSTVTPGCVT